MITANKFIQLPIKTDVYQGKSYWGENTYYQFDDQNGYLNVKDSSGNVYVFCRTSAPGGRTRSSYLANGASANGWDAQAEWNKIHNPITDVGGSNSSETKSNEGTSTNTHNSSRTCGYCHGNGRVRAHIGVSGFGLSTEKKKCPTCGVWYYTSEDHWHDCPYCKKK